MKARRILIACTLISSAALSPTLYAHAKDQAAPESSGNVQHLDDIQFDGGTELAASGRYIYAGELDGSAEFPSRGTKPEEGGLHIIDTAGKSPREVGFLHCPGNDNDIEVVEPGLVAVGHGPNKCNPTGHGFFLVDVRKPKRPRIIGAYSGATSSHTIKPYPGESLIYINPGGLGGASTTQIVDISEPSKPKLVGSFMPNASGCHDLSFHLDEVRKLAFCSGLGETQIWDVSDPLVPVTIGRIHNPLMQFQHYAVASSDGKLLAIDDEAFAAHECNTGQTPTGRVWIYDITNPSIPLLQSSYAAPRGGGDAPGIGHALGWAPTWCLSHGLDWQPGTRNLAVTWFTGGWSVLDLTDPLSPKEVAYATRENASTYSALWHKDRLYTNDFTHGFDAFAIDLLGKD